MHKITSSIERSDLNTLNYNNIIIENSQKILIDNDTNFVTFLSPMIDVIISMLTDKLYQNK